MSQLSGTAETFMQYEIILQQNIPTADSTSIKVTKHTNSRFNLSKGNKTYQQQIQPQ